MVYRGEGLDLGQSLPIFPCKTLLGTPSPPPSLGIRGSTMSCNYVSICQNHHQQKEAMCLCEQASWQASKGEGGGGVRGIREGNGQAVFSPPPFSPCDASTSRRQFLYMLLYVGCSTISEANIRAHL